MKQEDVDAALSHQVATIAVMLLQASKLEPTIVAIGNACVFLAFGAGMHAADPLWTNRAIAQMQDYGGEALDVIIGQAGTIIAELRLLEIGRTA